MPLQVAHSYKYAVLRFVYDAKRDLSAPAGVVVWGGPDKDVTFRIVDAKENIPELRGHDLSFFLGDTVRRINHWLQEGQLPFTDVSVTPTSDKWWPRVAKILHHRVRLSTPRPLECVDPTKETELLFDAVVAPRQSTRRRQKRISAAIDEGLGPSLARHFKKKADTEGYAHRSTTVTRLFETSNIRLVVEAVNLASPRQAESDAHSLVGKADWIYEGDKVAKFVVGYLASPGGLNGEAAYKKWIEKKLKTTCFDLVREKDAFREAVALSLEQINPQFKIAFDDHIKSGDA